MNKKEEFEKFLIQPKKNISQKSIHEVRYIKNLF